jgi:ABC-type phosphate transport system substrate-binding protein
LKGSLLGQHSLESGETDLVILTLPRENPPTAGFLALPFAFEVTRVVVNEASPVQELTLTQLQSVFAQASGAASDTTWGVIGGQGSWQTRQITLHAVRDRDHLNLELFRSIVMGSREMKVKVQFWGSPDDMIAAIAEDNTAMGLLPVEENHPQVRSLFLAMNEDSQAYNATPQSVYYGDYPLRLAFYVVANPSRGPAVSEIVRFLYSPEVSELLQANGYQPVPETERRQYQMDLDLGS